MSCLYIFVVTNFSVATSIDCERAFSLAGCIVSPLHPSLSDQAVQACVLLNSWSQVPGLLGEDELKAALVDGWKQSEKVNEKEIIEIE